MTRRPHNYYELLGVSPDASPEEIHSAYRRLARRYHPDLNAGGDAGARFNELSDAYEVLHDPTQRASYDRSRAVETRPVSRQAPVFSAQRRRRDVPRFLDDEPGGVDMRLGSRRHVRVQLVVRWLR
jgi:curved DNA-binding protein CbpA